jgi:hypothetical protein
MLILTKFGFFKTLFAAKRESKKTKRISLNMLKLLCVLRLLLKKHFNPEFKKVPKEVNH